MEAEIHVARKYSTNTLYFVFNLYYNIITVSIVQIIPINTAIHIMEIHVFSLNETANLYQLFWFE